jgi:hypothetical protein
MESGLPIRESRWHRPRIYLTIVGLYLLIFPFFPLSWTGFLFGIALQAGGLGIGVAVFEVGPILSLLMGVAALSVIAASKLLRHKEKPFSISFISLIIWSFLSCLFALGFTVFGVVGPFPTEAGLTLLVVSGLMVFFLIKGMKEIQTKI